MHQKIQQNRKMKNEKKKQSRRGQLFCNVDDSTTVSRWAVVTMKGTFFPRRNTPGEHRRYSTAI